MKNSIIIPVFNNSKFTFNILTQLKGFNGEIIVVNDGSTDDTIELVSQFDVKLINFETNQGFAKAVNAGYRAATGDRIMFLNNDVVLKSLKGLEESFDKIKENYLCGPTGGFVDLRTNEFKYHTDAISKRINYISGWCLFAFKTTFDKFMENDAGPFTEEFVTYFEDTYMGLRSQQVGVKFKLIKVPLEHIENGTSSKLNLEKIYLSAREKFKNKVKTNFSLEELKKIGNRYGCE